MEQTKSIVSGVEHYCKWAEGTAKSENDLRWLILGPVGLFGLVLFLIPDWAALLVTAPLMVPILFFGGVALHHSLQR